MTEHVTEAQQPPSVDSANSSRTSRSAAGWVDCVAAASVKELEIRCYAATGCSEHQENPPIEDRIRATEQPDGTWKWEVLLD